MFDRLLRAGLFESERFQDLPDNTSRLAYVQLLVKADDFGNFEINRALVRFIRDATGGENSVVQEQSDLDVILTYLEGADLAKCYAVGNKRFGHLFRFKTQRRYISRHVPESPWDSQELANKRDEQFAKIRKKSTT